MESCCLITCGGLRRNFTVLKFPSSSPIFCEILAQPLNKLSVQAGLGHPRCTKSRARKRSTVLFDPLVSDTVPPASYAPDELKGGGTS
jgi:hypothetical protein